jgi:DUF2407 C-terminal domain
MGLDVQTGPKEEATPQTSSGTAATLTSPSSATDSRKMNGGWNNDRIAASSGNSEHEGINNNSSSSSIDAAPSRMLIRAMTTMNHVGGAPTVNSSSSHADITLVLDSDLDVTTVYKLKLLLWEEVSKQISDDSLENEQLSSHFYYYIRLIRQGKLLAPDDAPLSLFFANSSSETQVIHAVVTPLLAPDYAPVARPPFTSSRARRRLSGATATPVVPPQLALAMGGPFDDRSSRRSRRTSSAARVERSSDSSNMTTWERFFLAPLAPDNDASSSGSSDSFDNSSADDDRFLDVERQQWPSWFNYPSTAAYAAPPAPEPQYLLSQPRPHHAHGYTSRSRHRESRSNGGSRMSSNYPMYLQQQTNPVAPVPGDVVVHSIPGIHRSYYPGDLGSENTSGGTSQHTTPRLNGSLPTRAWRDSAANRRSSDETGPQLVGRSSSADSLDAPLTANADNVEASGGASNTPAMENLRVLANPASFNRDDNQRSRLHRSQLANAALSREVAPGALIRSAPNAAVVPTQTPLNNQGMAGSDRDFMWGFWLGFFVGSFMLVWLWMPTVPRKQKLGIIAGITVQVTLSILQQNHANTNVDMTGPSGPHEFTQTSYRGSRSDGSAPDTFWHGSGIDGHIEELGKQI